MSHVVVVEVQIKDLDVLAAVCEKLGLEFRKNQKTFKWYGRYMGDYPLPKGFTKEDLGKCDHAIGVPDKPEAYEVGVCKHKDDKEGYQLLWDFWQGGFGLEAKVGKNCENLIGEYTKEVAKKEVTQLAMSEGWTMNEAYNDQTGETIFTLRSYDSN